MNSSAEERIRKRDIAINEALENELTDEQLISLAVPQINLLSEYIAGQLFAQGYLISVLDVDEAFKKRKQEILGKIQLDPSTESAMVKAITEDEEIKAIIALLNEYSESKSDSYQLPRLMDQLSERIEQIASAQFDGEKSVPRMLVLAKEHFGLFSKENE